VKVSWFGRLLKKSSRLKSALRGHIYVVDSPCSVCARTRGSEMVKGLFQKPVRDGSLPTAAQRIIKLDGADKFGITDLL
jgi:hypothetical protein